MRVEVGCRAERDKGEKKWDNYNCIISKIYFKEKKKSEAFLSWPRLYAPVV